MKITPPEQFRHAGQLWVGMDTLDPRQDRFVAAEVVVDLRACEFVNPAAALWCVAYLSLARLRGSECTLLVPMNMGVCIFLRSIGLFDLLLERGVRIDTQGIPDRVLDNTVLPVTCFHSVADVHILVKETFERLQSGRYAAANLAPIVTELFAEVALNAAQHSYSPVGSFACIQFHECRTESRFTCTVADGGIGILKSLHRYPALRNRVFYDWDALDLVIRELVSGRGDPQCGIGLYGVGQDVRKPHRALLIHSGLGSLEIRGEIEIPAQRTRLFPGTLVTLAISG